MPRSGPFPSEGSLEDVAGGEVRLEVVAAGDGRELRLVREEDGRSAPVGTFPAGVANPLLLYFLETTVRAMAEATGGSPYYIRNRIREALGAAGLGPEGAPRRGDAHAVRGRRQPGADGRLCRPRDPAALRSGAAGADPRTFG